tara:strand:- start:166 stop:621 length:456 start_codon:yes stop_codon:yes gene_type:complete
VEHIGVLANAMSRADIRINGHRLHPQEMAVALANANYASIEARYPGQWDLMGGGCSLIAFRAQCAREATRPDPNLKPIDLIKMAQGFAYQACEHEGWMQASFNGDYIGEHHIQQFIGHMIRKMPGYDDAPWHYERDTDAPEVVDITAMMGV